MIAVLGGFAGIALGALVAVLLVLGLEAIGQPISPLLAVILGWACGATGFWTCAYIAVERWD